MKFKLKAYSIWEFGQRKDPEGNPHQEDSIFPAHGEMKDSDRLFILCDGMGGHDAGEVASRAVCDAMSETILKECPDADGPFTADDFVKAKNAAYEALDAKDTGGSKKMGTTMTMLKFYNGGVFIAHIGDSRVYHIRPGKDGENTVILHQTEDHSLINDLIRMGEMTREEARRSGQKNVITRAMQPGEENRCKADVQWIHDIRKGDYFYLCSDGMLEQDEMESGEALKNIFSQAIKSDEERVKILTGATDENRDNHTAIIVHVLDVKKEMEENDIQRVEAIDTPQHEALIEDSSTKKNIFERQRINRLRKASFLYLLVDLLIISGLICLIVLEIIGITHIVHKESEADKIEMTDRKPKKNHKGKKLANTKTTSVFFLNPFK